MKNYIAVIFFLTTIFFSLKIVAQIPVSPNLFDSHGNRNGKWTILYNDSWNIVADPDSALYYRTLSFKKGKPEGAVSDYYLSDIKQWEGSITKFNPDCIDGISIYYFPNRHIQTIGYYKNCTKDGIWFYWDSIGKSVTILKYINGKEDEVFNKIQNFQYSDYAQIKLQYFFLKEKVDKNNFILKQYRLNNLFDILSALYSCEANIDLKINKNRYYNFNKNEGEKFYENYTRNVDSICKSYQLLKGGELIYLGIKSIENLATHEGIKLINKGNDINQANGIDNKINYFNEGQTILNQASNNFRTGEDPLLLSMAMNYFIKSKRLFEKDTSKNNLLVRIYFNLVDIYIRQGSSDMALNILNTFHDKELAKIKLDSNYIILEKGFYFNKLIGNYREMELMLLKYFDTYKSFQNLTIIQKEQLTNICILLGENYLNYGDTDNALKYCNTGINIDTNVVNKSYQINMIMGGCKLLKDELEDAESNFKKAWLCLKYLGETGNKNLKTNSAYIFTDRMGINDTSQESQKEFEQNLSKYRTSIYAFNHPDEAIEILNNLAKIELKWNNDSIANDKNIRAINLLSWGGKIDKTKLKNIFSLQGLIYENINNIPEAKKCYDFVISIETNGTNSISIPSFKDIPGGYIAASPVLKKNLFDLATLLHIGSFYRYQLNDGKLSNEITERAINNGINNFLSQQSILSNTISDFVYSASVGGLRDDYISYLMNFKGSKTKMFDYLLSTKALIINSNSNIVAQIKNSKDKIVLEKYSQLGLLDKNLSKLLESTTYVNQENIEELQKKSLMLENEILFLSKIEKPNNILYSSIDLGKKISKDEAVVEVIKFNLKPSNKNTYAALILTSETKEHPKLVLLKNGNNLDSTYYTHYQQYLTNPKQRQDKDWESYQNYWAAIDSAIGDKKIVYVSPDGVYNKINLQTLVTPDGRYLSDKKDIRIIGSSKDLLLPALPLKKSAKDAMLVGNPNFKTNNTIVDSSLLAANQHKSDALLYTTRSFDNTDVSQLPSAEKEVIKISSLLKNYNYQITTLTGNDAQEAKIKVVVSPSILHIATHGFFEKDLKTNDEAKSIGGNYKKTIENTMLRSGLLLAGAENTIKGNYKPSEGTENGILTAYEVQQMNLDSTELVVLSACETGLGDVKNGEGVYGLQRAFRIAGAKTIIMSLWKVDDEATQLLMTSFYENWLSGKTKREAFKNAQEMLKKSTRYSHPYYWGAFVLIGE